MGEVVANDATTSLPSLSDSPKMFSLRVPKRNEKPVQRSEINEQATVDLAVSDDRDILMPEDAPIGDGSDTEIRGQLENKLATHVELRRRTAGKQTLRIHTPTRETPPDTRSMEIANQTKSCRNSAISRSVAKSPVSELEDVDPQQR